MPRVAPLTLHQTVVESCRTALPLEQLDITVANYASSRLSKIVTYGLVERVAQGLYRITDDGEASLNEELDASELEPVDDSE